MSTLLWTIVILQRYIYIYIYIYIYNIYIRKTNVKYWFKKYLMYTEFFTWRNEISFCVNFISSLLQTLSNWKRDSFAACLRWRLSEIPVQIIYPASSWGLIRKQPITFGDLPLVDGLARFQNNSTKLARARLEKKALILSNTDCHILSPFFNRCSHLKTPANELYF